MILLVVTLVLVVEFSEQLWNEEVKKGRRVLSWKGVFQSFLLTVSLVDFSLLVF